MLPTATRNRHNDPEPYLWSDEQILAVRVPYVWPGLADGSGVYFLYSGDQLAYVGQSKKLRYRLYRHGFPNHTRRPVSWLTHYAVIPVPVEWLDPVENFFIHLYEPPLNKRYLPLCAIAAQYLQEV